MHRLQNAGRDSGKTNGVDRVTTDKPIPIGRFAPSPTGSLHLGSLYTALAGFLHARSLRGKWLIRIDDLDTPRNIKGSADTILATLDAFGLHWDDNVDYQSHHLDLYNDRLNDLAKNGLIYPCTCSRKTLSSIGSGLYPGICRSKPYPPEAPHALRVKTDSRIIAFRDELQGLISHNLAEQDGDFILKRKDRIIAYQFAVVIDDDRQHINHIVRGCDLLDETPKQIYLQQLLGLTTPAYMHLPVIVDSQGYKLSKQTRATAVDSKTPEAVIFELLHLLKQNPPQELQHTPVNELLDWAVVNWNPAPLKKTLAVMSGAITRRFNSEVQP